MSDITTEQLENGDGMTESDNSELETPEQMTMGGGASNFKPWLFKKGTSGNPKGRPPGTKSLKSWVKDYLHNLPDEQKEAFINGMPKDIIWRMGEGQPHQSTDTELKGVVKIEFAKDFDVKPAQQTESDNPLKVEVQSN